jgi:hypothetical protein
MCPAIMDDINYTAEEIWTDMRGFHYSELFLLCPGSDIGGIWNTTLFNRQAQNSRDSFPEELVANYSDEKAAAEYGAEWVWMEPPRVWLPDQIIMYRSPTVRNFAGLDTRGGATFGASAFSGGESQAYVVNDVTRVTTFWFDVGQPIWVLEDPDGTVYVQQSVTDQSGGYDGLDALTAQLDLPEGWTRRKVVLGDTPLTINGITADDGTENYWSVVQDDQKNSYSGCIQNSAGDSSCNFIPGDSASEAAAQPPLWPTDQETPEQNPCLECTCPAIMDDLNYLTEQIWMPTRGFRYSELFLTCPGSDTGGIWNTTLFNLQAADSRDSFPDELVANYSDEKAAAEYGAESVWMEPARVWTHDRMRIYSSPTYRNFSGLNTRGGASYDASGSGSGGENPTYQTVDVVRNSTFWYDAGQPIWVLDAPDGNTYINQSVTDDSGGYDGLDTLGERLVNLPEGWTFRKVTLGDTPLTINGITADDGTENMWKVVQDEFHNSYSACWSNSAGDSSCNFNP